VLSLCQQPRTKIVAVRDNHTRMQVPPEALGITAIQVNSYLEALGALVADRAGISLELLNPASREISTGIASLKCLP